MSFEHKYTLCSRANALNDWRKRQIKRARVENELLRAENEQLRQEVEDFKLKEKICSDCEAHPEYLRWKKENEQLRQELQRAKDVLRYCLPAGDGSLEACHFCGEFRSHNPDCAYINMIGGVE